MGKFSTLGFAPVSWVRQFGQWLFCGLEETAVWEVTLTITANQAGREWSRSGPQSGVWQHRDLGSGPGAEACWDSLGGVLAFQGLGNPLWPGAGDAVPESVLAPPQSQHFLIPAPNNNNRPSCGHSNKPRPPGIAPGPKHVTATVCVSPSAPGAAGGRGSAAMTFIQSSPWI